MSKRRIADILFVYFARICASLSSLARLLWVEHPLNLTRFRKGRECSLAEMFCVKCKEKNTVPDDQTTMEKTAKGRNMLRAVCPTCGTNMAKFTK